MPIVGPKVLAERLSVTPQRVSQLVHQGMPRVARGKYDLDACLAWLEDCREDSPHRADASNDITKERTRYYAAQAALCEHRLATQRKEVVDLAAFQTALTALVSGMLQGGDTWVDQAPDARGVEVRRELWWDLRERLVSGAETIVDDLVSAETAQATGLRERRRVG